MLSTTDFVWTQKEGCIFPLALEHLFQTCLGDFQSNANLFLHSVFSEKHYAQLFGG